MLQWHLGIFAWEYTPSFRGYDSYLGYLGGAQDYWAHSDGPCTPTAASNWQCPTRVNGSDYASLDFVFQQQPNCGAGCSTFPAQFHSASSLCYTTAYMEVALTYMSPIPYHPRVYVHTWVI